MSSSESEHNAQVATMEWCMWKKGRYPQLKWIHSIPNGAKLPYKKLRNGKRFSSEAIKLKAEGLRSGVSDIFLPYPNYDYCGLYVEMKVGRNTPTEEQYEFMEDMNAAGFLAISAWGSDLAIASIATYAEIPKDDWW